MIVSIMVPRSSEETVHLVACGPTGVLDGLDRETTVLPRVVFADSSSLRSEDLL
jgi:hypothetical protein